MTKLSDNPDQSRAEFRGMSLAMFLLCTILLSTVLLVVCPALLYTDQEDGAKDLDRVESSLIVLKR